jgi:protein SCO1/2
MRRGLAVFAALLIPILSASTPASTSPAERSSVAFDGEQALRVSQAAIGRTLSEQSFLNRRAEQVRISDYRGKPLLISLIYTSCYHSCSVFTRYLGEIVEVAREALGEDAFSVATIGFDAVNDSPARMAIYASGQDIEMPGWSFLSGDVETIKTLTTELGFTYAASPKGFDHMAQVSVVDANGTIYRQVYGDRFDPPALVEPLKELVFGLDASSSSIDRWVDNVRLFCTIYDPSTGRYRFDYSIFFALIIGILCLASIAIFIVRAWRQSSTPLPH